MGHQARLVRLLRNGVDRLERLVAESLDYAQMQSQQLELNLEQAGIAGVVRNVVELVEPSATAKHQRIDVDIPPDLPEFLMDTQRVERILVNLLSNASRFTPSGGEITVRVFQMGTQVITEVSDNGPGIPEDEQAFIFNEYYRGHNPDMQRNSGSGLGLTISKYLVEMHGGTIEVRSQPGKGATFSFSLPVDLGSVSEGMQNIANRLPPL